MYMHVCIYICGQELSSSYFTKSSDVLCSLYDIPVYFQHSTSVEGLWLSEWGTHFSVDLFSWLSFCVSTCSSFSQVKLSHCMCREIILGMEDTEKKVQKHQCVYVCAVCVHCSIYRCPCSYNYVMRFLRRLMLKLSTSWWVRRASYRLSYQDFKQNWTPKRVSPPGPFLHTIINYSLVH